MPRRTMYDPVDPTARQQVFVRTWLPTYLAPTEYAQVRDLPATLLQDMYADVWAHGPMCTEIIGRFDQLMLLMDRLVQVDTADLGAQLTFQREVYETFWAERWHGGTTGGLTNRYAKQLLPPHLDLIAHVRNHQLWMSGTSDGVIQAAGGVFRPGYNGSFCASNIVLFTAGEHILHAMAATSVTARKMLVRQAAFWEYVTTQVS